MEVKCNIDIGKDEYGEFLQHSMELNDTVSSVTRQYYKIIDKALLEHMPTGILVDLVNKGQAIIETRIKEGKVCMTKK